MTRGGRWVWAAALVCAAVLGGAAAWAAEKAPAPAAAKAEAKAADEEGFVAIFNGKDLTGWAGDPNFWSVQDGAIVGQTTKEKPTKGNTFLIWQGGQPGDFELRMKFKLENHNSGIQFRSKQVPGNFVVGGYQADMDGRNSYTGMLYEEKGRGILGRRGTKLVIEPDGKKNAVGKTCTEEEFKKAFKTGDWNEFVIVAKGDEMKLSINGVPTFELTDKQESKRAMKGIIALQLHAGPPMKVAFKDIRLKELK